MFSRLNIDEILRVMVLSGPVIASLALIWLIILAFRTRWIWGFASLFLLPLVAYIPRYPLRTWKPSLLLFVGLFLTVIPPFYTLLTPIDLGPRERIVDGERHITITGWDKKDYSFLGSKSDAVVLQMANADVTDATLERLRPFANLRELDVNDTSVTDAGLKVLRELPKLQILRLKNTKITDAGFRESLKDRDNLQMLELAGTGVTTETVKEWKAAKPKRKALL